MYHRTPEDWRFSIEWDHSSKVLVSKTVKDMIIHGG